MGISNSKDSKEYVKTPEFEARLDLVLRMTAAFGFAKAKQVLDAVFDYKENAHLTLNRLLRRKTPVKSALVAHMETYFIMRPRDACDVVYRGVSKPLFDKLIVGQELIDSAYMSCSRSRVVAQRFTDGLEYRSRVPGGLLRITGVSGIGVEPWIGTIRHDSEEELLLPRNCVFEVLAITGSVAELKFLRIRTA